MGVPTFYKWLSVKYPRIVKDAVEGTPLIINGEEIPVTANNGDFDTLYLDMNGIIHPCCHPEDGAAPKTEDEMFRRIFEYIDRLWTLVRPRKLLYMAIDGVAPRAKMNQQRTRRFKAAAEAEMEEKNFEELKEIFEKEGRSIPVKTEYWDSNVITPGTPFLDKLSQAIKYYVNVKMTTDPTWRDVKVILSDANSPGEGEHKIMQYIRSQRTYPNYNPNLRHCLYGADADLIMLGLATHEPHFFILRESVLDRQETNKCYQCGKPGHLAADCVSVPAEPDPAASSKSSWKPMQFLQIGVLREYLQREFAFKDCQNFEPNLERCIDDFVMMCFFVGNDFLPHLPSLSIHKGSIDQMLLLYQKVRPTFSDYLTDGGKINLPQMEAFVRFLGLVEDNVFQEDQKREKRNGQRKLENEERRRATANADGNFAALRELQEQLGRGSEESLPAKRRKLEEGVIEKRSHEQDIDEFKAEIRQKRKLATEIEDPEDNAQLGVGERSDWRRRYYTNKFHLTTDDEAVLDTFASKVSQCYVEGLRWVLGYYYQGICSWEWFYPFHYAPFASDLATFGAKEQKDFCLGTPFKPFDQLMAVLPSRSGHCLPRSFAALMKNPTSAIIDFYPKEFKEDPNGRRHRWQWVCLLPFIDQQRLLNTLKTVESTLTDDEKRRNEKGLDRLFVSQFHSLAQQMALIQLGTEPHEVTQKVLVDFSDKMAGVLTKSSLGYVSGVVIDAGSCSSELFPPSVATTFSCGFTSDPLKPHVCAFLPGAIPTPPILTELDIQEDGSSDRRFNSGAAKRMIMACLGRQGIVAKTDVDVYFQYRNNNQRSNQSYNPSNQPGMHSDNRYQAEMFGGGGLFRGAAKHYEGACDRQQQQGSSEYRQDHRRPRYEENQRQQQQQQQQRPYSRGSDYSIPSPPPHITGIMGQQPLVFRGHTGRPNHVHAAGDSRQTYPPNWTPLQYPPNWITPRNGQSQQYNNSNPRSNSRGTWNNNHDPYGANLNDPYALPRR